MANTRNEGNNDVSIRIDYLLTFLASVLPWLFPSLLLIYKALITLIVLCVALIILCYKAHKKNTQLKKDLDSVKERHKALSVQFDEKDKTIKNHKKGVESLEILITQTILSSKEDRFQICANQFHELKLTYFDESENEVD